MDTPDRQPVAVHTLPARRISTTEPPASSREESVGVIAEAPLLIDVENVGKYTVLCTPVDRRYLAVGFLFSEGIIASMDEVALLRECEDDSDVVRVKLADKVTDKNVRPTEMRRNLVILSSCGACGSEEFAQNLKALPGVGNRLHIQAVMLRTALDEISRNQPLFEACGGAHWAGIFDAGGKLLACAEDAGRHNALDKAIGKCLCHGIPFAGCWAALSGRVSLEMVGKCARAGLELIAAISAPTSLAVETAERCGITLCAFVRENRATIFTHAGRIV